MEGPEWDSQVHVTVHPGAEWKRRKLAADEEREVADRDFRAYGLPLDMVTSFKYLGQVIMVEGKEWTEVVNKFSRARKVWSRMSLILSREGVAPRVSILFFTAVVQALLIFTAETYVVTPLIGKAMGGGFIPRC